MAITPARVNDEPAAHAGETRADLDALQERLDALRDDLADADKRLRAFVRERPFVAVGAAVAAGFLFGRLLRRV
ncbi:MAG: hypothetical protein SF182_01905 [Deltaproteobacteria bacterium]|nr:hypothetical protein [Deltaproteobacteria bacterium]